MNGILRRSIYTALTLTAGLLPLALQAGGQRVGSWESAIDIPWRVTPSSGGVHNSRIPVNISIMDANYRYYTDDCDYTDYEISDCDNPAPERIKLITVTEMDEAGNIVGTRTYDQDTDVASVEKTVGYWRKGWGLVGNRGVPDDGEGQFLCMNEATNVENCDVSNWFDGIGRTSEYHVIIGYQPFRTEPGLTFLQVDVQFVATDGHTRSMRSKVTTNLARDELPKFDSGYAYGDLHYHSQGTDNTGEFGYSYREAYHAANAIGLDWFVASDHANNTDQVTFLEVEINPGTLWGLATSNLAWVADDNEFGGLSDMSWPRWQNHWGLINGDGPNAWMKFVGLLNTGEASFPSLRQRTQVGNFRVPNIVLGGEIDYIPEVARNAINQDFLSGTVAPFTYKFWKSCLEYPKGDTGSNLATKMAVDSQSSLYWQWVNPESGQNFGGPLGPGHQPNAICDPLVDTWHDFGDGWLGIKDVQGTEGMGFSRQHLVHVPRNVNDPNAWIISDTNRSGGASRRLSEIHQTEYVEGQKGYGFLAHPLAGTGGHSLGRLGPDMMPLHPSQIQRAMEMEYILGLQAWNENEKFETDFAASPTHVMGYDCLSDTANNGAYYPVRKSAALREIGVHDRWDEDGDAFYDLINQLADQPLRHCNTIPTSNEAAAAFYDPVPGLGDTKPGLYLEEKESHWRSIVGGFMLTDVVNLWGLQMTRVKKMPFLQQDEPRKMFIAGGSDAHGDLAQRRIGYTTGLTGVNDTAMGTPRNLVMTGSPDGQIVHDGAWSTGQMYSWEQVLEGLKDGNFSVTDGPAVRIAIDNNKNGVIDEADTPMGGTLVLPHWKKLKDQTLNVLVEYKSTEDFGKVDWVYLFLGGMPFKMDTAVHYGPRSGVYYESLLLPEGDTRWGAGEMGLKNARKVKAYDDSGNLIDKYNFRQNQDPERPGMKTWVNYTNPLQKQYGTGANYTGTARFAVKVSDFPLFTTEHVVDSPDGDYEQVKTRFHLSRMYFRAEVSTVPSCAGGGLRTCSKPYVATTNPVWAVDTGWKGATRAPVMYLERSQAAQKRLR